MCYMGSICKFWRQMTDFSQLILSLSLLFTDHLCTLFFFPFHPLWKRFFTFFHLKVSYLIRNMMGSQVWLMWNKVIFEGWDLQICSMYNLLHIIFDLKKCLHTLVFCCQNCSDLLCTAILYRASTGPEQGFPCEVFHTGKNLFSL